MEKKNVSQNFIEYFEENDNEGYIIGYHKKMKFFFYNLIKSSITSDTINIYTFVRWEIWTHNLHVDGQLAYLKTISHLIRRWERTRVIDSYELMIVQYFHFSRKKKILKPLMYHVIQWMRMTSHNRATREMMTHVSDNGCDFLYHFNENLHFVFHTQ